jgi:hypothetical protein
MDQSRVSANSNTEEVYGRANQNYRTWLSPQAFVWKKAFRVEKPAAAGKFNSAGIRPPLHQPTTQG